METSSGNHHLPLNNCSSVLILDETVSVGSLSVGSDVRLFSSQNSRLGLEQSILHKPLFPHITPIPYLLALPQADHLMLPFRGMSTIHLAYLELWNPLWFFFCVLVSHLPCCKPRCGFISPLGLLYIVDWWFHHHIVISKDQAVIFSNTYISQLTLTSYLSKPNGDGKSYKLKIHV